MDEHKKSNIKKAILKVINGVCNIEDIFEIILERNLESVLAEKYGFKKPANNKKDEYVYALYFKYKNNDLWGSKIAFYKNNN